MMKSAGASHMAGSTRGRPKESCNERFEQGIESPETGPRPELRSPSVGLVGTMMDATQ